VNREVTGSSGGLYTLHGVWERPPANNLLQTPHSAGAYGTGYVFFLSPDTSRKATEFDFDLGTRMG